MIVLLFACDPEEDVLRRVHETVQQARIGVDTQSLQAALARKAKRRREIKEAKRREEESRLRALEDRFSGEAHQRQEFQRQLEERLRKEFEEKEAEKERLRKEMEAVRERELEERLRRQRDDLVRSEGVIVFQGPVPGEPTIVHVPGVSEGESDDESDRQSVASQERPASSGSQTPRSILRRGSSPCPPRKVVCSGGRRATGPTFTPSPPPSRSGSDVFSRLSAARRPEADGGRLSDPIKRTGLAAERSSSQQAMRTPKLTEEQIQRSSQRLYSTATESFTQSIKPRPKRR